jgi:hypothetical protein
VSVIISGDKPQLSSTGGSAARYRAGMSIKATIMDAATGEAIENFVFGRRPVVGTDFIPQSGERVTAQRVESVRPRQASSSRPWTSWSRSKAECDGALDGVGAGIPEKCQ